MPRLVLLLVVGLMIWLAWRWIKKRRQVIPVRAAEIPPVAPASRPTAASAASVAMDPKAQIPGRRTIMLATLVAVLSMATDWVEFFFLFVHIERTGLQIGMAVLLVLLIYPCVAAWRRWRLWPRLAGWCVGLSAVAGLAIWYTVAHVKVWIFTLDMTGVGVLVYLGSILVLAGGVSLYAEAYSAGSPAKQANSP